MPRSSSPTGPNRKKTPQILEATRIQMANVENINTIREATHGKFWQIPPKTSLQEKKIKKERRGATLQQGKETQFERKVRTKTLPLKNSRKEQKPAEKTEGEEVFAAPDSSEKEREHAGAAASAAVREKPATPIRESEEKILGIFKKHPILLLQKYLMVLIVTAILLFILSVFFQTRYHEIFEWGFWGVVLGAVAFITDLYIRWSLNVSIFTEDRIISLQHSGMAGHTLEIIPMASINFLDFKQEGLLKTIFNFGDVHITSFITESNKDMTLANIAHVKKAFEILEGKTHAIKKPES